MGIIAKVCSVLAVFGALNGVALSMWNKDAVTMTIGHADAGHIVRAVVGMASIVVVIWAVKPKK